ncbi:TNF receptor-associated factor 6-like isoform X2 [Dysidea avara]
MVDKNFMRQLYGLKVLCIYEDKGCVWIGDYGKIENHLQLGKEKGECEFVMVKCPLSIQCKESIARKVLTDHVTNVCKYRQFSCKFCGFLSTYEVVTTLHKDECEYYPIPCPNYCSKDTYPRCQVKYHIANCPEQEVACTFSEIGCKEKMKRQMLQKHLGDNTILHQTMMCRTITEQMNKLESQNTTIRDLEKDKKELESKVHDLTREVVTLKQQSCEDQWVNGLRSVTKKIMGNNWPLYLSKMVEITAIEPIVPVVFKVPLTITKRECIGRCYGYQVHNHYDAPIIYQSSPFYSHHNGYKLCLSVELVCRCLCCTAQHAQQPYSYEGHDPYQYERPEDVKGVFGTACYSQSACIPQPHENLSLLIHLSTVKSEYDRQLKWPFQKRIAVNLLNDESDSDHNSITKEYIGTTTGSTLQIVPTELKSRQQHTTAYRDRIKWKAKQPIKKPSSKQMQPPMSQQDGHPLNWCDDTPFSIIDRQGPPQQLKPLQDKYNSENSILFSFDANEYVSRACGKNTDNIKEHYRCECYFYLEVTL